MKCDFLLFIMLITSGHLFAQDKTAPSDHSIDKIFTKAEYAPTYGNNPTDLQRFFDNAFSNIKKNKSRISLMLLIDTAGKASVSSVYYMTPSIIDEAAFNEIVNTMPVWHPARMHNRNVKSVAPIFLTFNKKSVQVSYEKSQTATN